MSVRPKIIFYWIIVVGIILSSLTLSITSILEKSLTYDELLFIGVGKYRIETGDTTPLVEGAPIFPSLLNGMFWYFLDFDPHYWEDFRHNYSHQYRRLNNLVLSGHDPDILVLLARLPIILTFPLLSILVFVWSRELYGAKAGLLALILSALSPNLIAHARLATTDFIACLTILAAVYCFRCYLKKPSRARLALSGITLGLSLITKTTSTILLPAFLVMALVYRRTDDKIEQVSNTTRKKLHFWSEFFPKNRDLLSIILFLALIIGVAFSVIWAAYFFEFRVLFFLPDREVSSGDYSGAVLKFLCEKGIKIPAASFFEGVYTQYRHAVLGHANFFFGEISSSGRWNFFIFAFLIKTPLPTLALLFLSVIFLKRAKSCDKREEAFLLIPTIFIMVTSSISNINIGLRHILPIYPFLFVWISRVATFSKSALYSALLAVLTVWYICSNIYIYPHYLAYFNELIGGPRNGYKYLVDSNLDWGQDLRALLKHVDENDIRPIKIIYFGAPRLLEYNGYHAPHVECFEIQSGYIAISVTHLQSVYLLPGCFEWLKEYEPIKRIGYSIHIYEIPP